ncbi:hypothetical protein D3C81_816520 [compost metagenome]
MPAKNFCFYHLCVFEGANFKPGGNIGDFAFGWDHRADHAFTRRPLSTGKIAQITAGVDIAGVDTVFAHQALCMLNALPILIAGDFRRIVRQRLQLFQGLLRRATANACSHASLLA